MSTGTRAGSAALSRRIKQEIVRQLFGQQYSKKGPEAHRRLDHTIYSYSQLRTAYLERVQEIHPDKIQSKGLSSLHKQTSNRQFSELQEAWRQYESLVKSMKDVSQADANFTMFGVGCSFSDNESERALRDEITDQACRGWFSSGEIAEFCQSTNQSNDLQNSASLNVSLLDDDMFVSVEESTSTPTKEDWDSCTKRKKSSQPIPSLIPNMALKRR